MEFKLSDIPSVLEGIKKYLTFKVFIFILVALFFYVFLFKPEVGFMYIEKYLSMSKNASEAKAMTKKVEFKPKVQEALDRLRGTLDARLVILISLHNDRRTIGGFPYYFADGAVESLRPNSGVHSHLDYWKDVRIDDAGAFQHIWDLGGTWDCTHAELDAVDNTNQFEHSHEVTRIFYEIIWRDPFANQNVPAGVLCISFDSISNTVGKNIEGIVGLYRSTFREFLTGEY